MSSFVRINSCRAANKSTEADSDDQSCLFRASLSIFPSIFDSRSVVANDAFAAAVDSVAVLADGSGFRGRTVCVAISLTRFGSMGSSNERTFVVVIFTGRKSIRFRSMDIEEWR